MANDTKSYIKMLVDQFLAWQLPESVCSDLCVTIKNHPYPRSGTNLLTADEAAKMFDHVIEAVQVLSIRPSEQNYRRVFESVDQCQDFYCKQLISAHNDIGELETKYLKLRAANEHLSAVDHRDIGDIILRNKRLIESLEEVLTSLKTSYEMPDAIQAVMISPSESLRRAANDMEKRDAVILKARKVLSEVKK